MIDLRSDTVTRPSAEMLKAMMSAPVGDDVFSEDPTVNELERATAEMFGKEAGLFCPSGTMTNQIAIKLHTQPGDELICDVHSHIYNFEGGGISFNSGVQARLLSGREGKLNAEQIGENINGDFDWLARTSLVSLENTVNRAGGSYYTIEEIVPVADLCRKKNLKLHLDGARIFNALTESKDSPSETGRLFDSVSVCLSKGLGAPVGSVLVGDRDLIRRGRRIRKQFGGGMRQAGFLAAAGLYALKNNVERLKEDHHHARSLAEVLKELPFVSSILPVYTNIVIFKLDPERLSAGEFEKTLAGKGIRVSAFGKNMIRMVTHLDFDSSMLDKTVETLRKLVTEETHSKK